MSTGTFTVVTEFTVNNQTVKLEKFKRLNVTMEFKDECLPMIIPHLRPLEVVLSSLINGYAPPDMALLSTMIIAEKEIDAAMLPAFRIMLKYYLPEWLPSDESLYAAMNDLTDLYTIVFSQMQIERISDFYLRRKVTFIANLARFFNVNIDSTDISSIIENKVKGMATMNPDSEVRGV